MSPSLGTAVPSGTGTRSPERPPGEGLTSSSPSPRLLADTVPARATGVELLGTAGGSGYRRPPSLVRRGDGQTIQLTPVLARVLQHVDGRRTYGEIAGTVSEREGRLLAPEDVQWLIETKLRPLGLLRKADGSEPALKKANPLLALRFRKVVTNPHVTRRITAPFAWLFRPFVVIPMVVAFALTTAWVLFEKGLAAPTYQALHQPGMLLLVLALVAISAGFHEFGHAAACRYVGATPGSMGVGVYLVWPVFFTDVTDSYRLGRRERVVVDVGGLYFNMIFTVASLGAWAATRWDALLLLVPAQLLHMLRQLIPFVRFDGYHILADLTGVPDLFAHIKPTLLRFVPGRVGRREPRALKPWVGAVVGAWVLAVIPLLAATLVLMVSVFPRVVATLAESLGPRWEAVQTSWGTGEPAEVGVGLVAIVAVAFPVLAMSYLLARMARRTSLRVWRATDGRPALRTTALLAATAGLILLAWSWWPNGQYRPIEPTDRGTLLDATRSSGGPGELALISDSSPSLAITGAPAGSLTPRLALIVSEEGVPVTEPGPKRIIILPQGDQGSPQTIEGNWVFPFDPPAPPGEGDNQALAVNTGLFSNVYDVAVAVVWVTDGGPVDNVNEAWAVASCLQCKTMAVAFQAVFIVGDADVVVPQNIAVAVNYNCQWCQTHAIAAQIVLTLDRMPSPEAMARLQEVWAEAEALEERIGEMTVEEIRAELERIKAKIVQILVEDGALAGTDESLAEASIEQDAPTDEAVATDPAAVEMTDPTTTDDTTTPPDSSGDTTPGPSPAAASSPAPTQAPSPSPTADPSPAPTESTPTPTP